MSRVEELERLLLEGARKELAPSARDRMRVQTSLIGNEAWFQPAPARSNTIRSLVRSWRGGVTLGFALGALLGFGASQGLGLLSSELAAPVERAAPPLVTPPAGAWPAAAPPAPALEKVVEPAPETVSAGSESSGGAQDTVAVERPAPVARREAAPRARAAASEDERSTLAQELALLQRARRALNRQDAQLALGIVQSLDERFPEGVLMEERAATRILSLCQLQRSDEARAQGQQFLAGHPRSVYAERVRNSCAGKQ